MSAHRPRRIDRDTAEQLLRGAPAGSRVGSDALVELLAAAAAPADAGKLAGERAAMAAFRAARPHTALQTGRRSMLKTALAKVLTVKAAAAAIAITAVGGGVALAASNGALPSGLGPDNAANQPAVHATGRPADTSTDQAGSASPSPSLVGLCRAYAAGVAENPGKALENPAFGTLISAAGGRDEVAGYCTDVLKAAPGDAPSVRPSHARPSPKATPSHPAPPEPAEPANPRVIPTPPAP